MINKRSLDNAIKEVKTADILLVIGTSMKIYPAASLIDYVKNNIQIIYIDPNDSFQSNSIIHIKKKATEAIDDIKKILEL